MKRKENNVNIKNEPGKVFCEKFERILKEHAVPQKQIIWYIRWIKRFLFFIQGKRLRDCTELQVKTFIEDLSFQANMEIWQRQQAVNALRLLFQYVLKSPWALSLNWTDFFPTLDSQESCGDISKRIQFKMQKQVFKDEF